MSTEELDTIELRVDTQLAEFIRARAAQCGLTPDQMASALTVLALDKQFRIAEETDKERELRDELNFADGVIGRLSKLLTRTVNTLRGEPPEDMLWSFHDIPDLVAGLKASEAADAADKAYKAGYDMGKEHARTADNEDAERWRFCTRHGIPLRLNQSTWSCGSPNGEITVYGCATLSEAVDMARANK